MTDYTRLCELLNKKKKLFFELEAVTDGMVGASVEEIEAAMEKRADIFSAIEATDKEISNAVKNDVEAKAAIDSKGSGEGLSAPLAAVYNGSLAVKAVANRILQNEAMVRKHIEAQLEKLRETIAELNTSGESTAEKYHHTVVAGLNKQLEQDKEKLI